AIYFFGIEPPSRGELHQLRGQVRQGTLKPSQFSASDNLENDFANSFANAGQLSQVAAALYKLGNIVFQSLDRLSGAAVCLQLEPVGAFQRKSGRIAAQKIGSVGVTFAHELKLPGLVASGACSGNILRSVSSVSASWAFLSVRQRSMRGKRTATPDLWRVER